jgi:oligopeptide/dipeptide ABC transporter ATP-binding protein
VTFALSRGETYALVGESGCGKSATALAIIRLVEPGVVAGGRVRFEGRELLDLPEREMRHVRGARIGFVFQEVAAALNPVLRIGDQVAEAVRAHRRASRAEARAQAERLLRLVALPDPEAQARSYAHELSGGMKQRAMLAIALASAPALLIADEPTTALDVTIQAQILEVLRRLRRELDLTVLLITHDLGVVAENADRVGIMYAGRIVEEAPVAELLGNPLHPYTRGLLASRPEHAAERARATGDRRLRVLPGAVPDPASWPAGCRFHPRCAERFDPCDREAPADTSVGGVRRVACFLHSPDRERA